MRFKRLIAVLLLIASISASGCGMFRGMMGGGNAKENAVSALVTTTRSAVVLMTLAGIAYDSGAFGAPGSARAEDTWNKIAAESLRLNSALNAWSDAIRTNKDTSAYAALVAQALAVLAAILPPRGAPSGGQALLPADPLNPARLAVFDFSRPLTFRAAHAYGGV